MIDHTLSIIRKLAAAILFCGFLLAGCGGGFSTDGDNPPDIDNTIFGGDTISDID